MRDELIRDMEAMENVVIYAAEQRDQVGQPRKRVMLFGAAWWLAKAVYDLLVLELRRTRKERYDNGNR